ncbi:MAG: methionine--tRNA ligase [Planctomycetota bacterium]|nr:MAG: methionine--tRNA ligase [Planctomycetota bacterium]
MRRILVTAALPYANGHIHMGHLVEYIQADIWARFQRLIGNDCAYICADDTHGTPIMIRARNEGISPEKLVQEMQIAHEADFAKFHIHFDQYHSTHSEENRRLAEEVYLQNKEAGHVTQGDVEQAYCPKDEMFLPDRFIRGTCPSCASEDQYGDACEKCGGTHSPTDLVDARCAVCGTPPERRSSKHLFFKLGDFSEFLQSWTRSGSLQDEVANKLDEWLKGGLRDWDISRDAPYFGFEIPGEPGKFFYVWLDAPIGYMASTAKYCESHGFDFDDYWRSNQTEVHHFIGKDIVYFHSLFWPAMLHGAGFRTPTAVWVHGHLTVDGKKMSKSRGTFINASTFAKHLDPEQLRYYYAYKLNGRVEDIDLSIDDFVARVNSDLVGKVVNLAARTAKFVTKQLGGRLAEQYPDDGGLFAEYAAAADSIAECYEDRDYARAMRTVMALAEKGNQFVESNAPWTLAKDPAKIEELREVCTIALNLFRSLVIYLKPVLPQLASKVESFLQIDPLQWKDSAAPLLAHEIGKFKHMMQRAESEKAAKMIEESKQGQAQAKEKSSKAQGDTQIAIEDFLKVDLRAAQITKAERVEGADKLLRLELDLGELGQRQVFAGIKSAYDCEQLKGRLVVCIANLKPRKMKFGLSEGMVLAAGLGGKDIHLLSVDAGAKPGDKIK